MTITKTITVVAVGTALATSVSAQGEKDIRGASPHALVVTTQGAVNPYRRTAQCAP